MARLLAVGLTALAGAACGSSVHGSVDGSPPGATASTAAGGRCAGGAIRTVVTVAQWGDIVAQLAGPCGDVATIISGSAIDPHDYEPTPADLARFDRAQLVVVNGLDYDAWADKAVRALAKKPPVVDAGDVVGLKPGDNPHVWYGPDHIDRFADAVTAALEQLRPAAAADLRARRQAFATALQPYRDEIAAIKQAEAGATYGATEAVFDDMAAALGLTDLTPDGYRKASANESDPSPADVDAFDQALTAKRMDVLIYNTQTEGSIPQQLRATAKSAGVPVVNVTETPPPGARGFVAWQLTQLRRLADALGVG